MSADGMDKINNEYGISRTSGVLISLAAIIIAGLLMLGLAYALLPSALDDVIGVFIASLIIPIVAAFKPLQTFVLFPEGLGLKSVFSKRQYKVLWADVTDVRLKQDIFGVTNLEFGRKNRVLYKKVPLTIMPKRREFLIELMKLFPADHPQRTVLELIVQPYNEQDAFPSAH